MQQKKMGILCMMVSVVLFSVMQLFVSLCSKSCGVFYPIFFRNLLGVFLCMSIIRKRKVSYFGNLKSQPYLMGRSFFGFLGVLFFFYATKHAMLADVSIVSRTGPFFTTIVAALFLHEKISSIQIPVLSIIFAGGLLVVDPSFDSSFIPLGAALLSAMCSGIVYPLLRYSREREDAMTVIMHFSTFSVLACIPFLIKDFSIPMGMDCIYLALVAATGAFGQIFLTYAYRLAPASEVAIYDQFTIVCSIILGYLFLNQTPSRNSLIGGTMIVGASVFAYFYHTRRKIQK